MGFVLSLLVLACAVLNAALFAASHGAMNLAAVVCCGLVFVTLAISRAADRIIAAINKSRQINGSNTGRETDIAPNSHNLQSGACD